MLQIAICDDDKWDLSRLKELIIEIMEEYSIRCNIYEYDSGEKLLESSLTFHIVFLDIMLGGRDGIDIGNMIYKKNRSIKIVFQTSYGQYCKEATNRTHAFAFLEKPLQKEILEEQILDFIGFMDNTEDIQVEFNHVKYVLKNKEIEELAVSVAVKTIILFEYMKQKKEVKVITENGTYVFSGTISAIEKKMKPLGFEICCRGILVNIAKIKKIKGYLIILNNDTILPLSQRRALEFRRRVNEQIHGSME